MRFPLLRRQLVDADCEVVVAAWVEVLEEIHAVEDVGDQLLQEESWRDSGSTAQLSADRGCEVPQVLVVDDGPDTLRIFGSGRVNVANTAAQLQQRLGCEACEANL